VVRGVGPFTGACEAGDRLSVPVKHTTGRFYAPEPELDRLESNGQVLLRYAPGPKAPTSGAAAHSNNPNGSLRDIAGVCNESRNVFGLMPHPEHAVDPLAGSVDGLKIFESMRAHVEQHVLA
jgi:phosphoribosylformylglycinamidine (FGAM) synthase-like amidotransferase family enzyme